MAEPAGHTLFTDLLRVANRAIEAHADASPWREIAEATQGRPSPTWGVAVVERDSEVPIDRFAIRVHDGRLELVAGRDVPGIDWRVPVELLRRVARDPDPYVDDPAKLQLGWIAERLGIRTR